MSSEQFNPQRAIANSNTSSGANGFMACPTSDNRWQVFADGPNAVVPSGNLTDCLGFDALTTDWTEGFGAWQYV